MSKFRNLILIIGLLLITVAAALLTVLVLYATGTIVTDPIELVYTAGSDEKVYDGTPLALSDGAYTLDSGNVLEGHTAQVKAIGSQTDAGTGESTLEVKIFDKKGFDVTDEYAIKVNAGTLTVEKQKISVVVPDSQIPYSGKKIYFNDYEITEGKLARGHKLAGLNTTLLNVGDSVPDDVAPAIYDSFDNDVSANYEISGFELGDIKITPRPLTLKPKNVTRVYDGTEFTATEYEILGGSFAPGQTAEYTVVTMDNEVATFLNCTDEYGVRVAFDGFKIYDEDRNEVDLNNYVEAGGHSSILETGLIKVTKRPLTLATATETFTYNGSDRFNDSVRIFAGSLADNQKIAVKAYTSVCNVTEEDVENVLTCEITFNGKDVSDNYAITFVTGRLSVKPYDLTLYTKSYTKVYDGNPLGDIIDADETNYELKVDLASKFSVSYEYDDAVKSQIDAVKETSYKLKNIEITLNDEEEDTVCTDNFNIKVVAGKYSITTRSATVQTPSATFVYDGAEHSVDDESEYKVDGLIAGHDFSLTDCKKVTGVSDSGLNLVQYDILSDGTSVKTNYDIKVSYGTLTVLKQSLKVESASEAFEYDNVEYSKTDDYSTEGLVGTHKLNIDETTATKVKDVTSGVSNTFNFTVVDAAGNDVSENYEVSFIPGMLEVTPKTVDVALSTALRSVYDGNVYTVTTAAAFAGVTLPDGVDANDFEIITFTEIKNANAYDYTAKYVGASKNYSFNINTGTVTIDKLTVNLTFDPTADISMTYSGANVFYSDDAKLIAALSVGTGTVTAASFNKTLESITVTGVTVRNDGGDDITSNLNVNFTGVNIPVKVNKCELNIQLAPYSNMYYVEIADLPACVIASGLAAGDRLVVTEADFSTDQATSYTLESYKILNSSGKDVTHYYTDAGKPVGKVTIIYN